MFKSSFIGLSLLSCSILFSAMTCNDYEYVPTHGVSLENNSGESIYYACDFYREALPLTPHVIFEESPGYGNNLRSLPNGGKDSTFVITEDGRDAIGLIIFKKSTLEKFTKKELVELNLYDKQYSLFYEDLKKMNFRITYTGE